MWERGGITIEITKIFKWTFSEKTKEEGEQNLHNGGSAREFAKKKSSGGKRGSWGEKKPSGDGVENTKQSPE